MALSLSGAWSSISGPVLALAEEMALHRAASGQPALTLRIRAAGIDAIRSEAGARHLLFTVSGRPQLVIAQMADELAGHLGPEVALTFAEDQAVRQQVILPLQSEEVLKAIVRNKVESLAPWPLAQCLWAMRASPIAGDPLHVAVDVAVVSRAAFDDLAMRLQATGATVKALSIMLTDGDELEVDLGSNDIRRVARVRAIGIAKFLGAGLIILLGLGLYSIYNSNAEAARLEQETAAAVAAFKPSGALAGESPLVSAANRLYQQRAGRLPAIAILDEVTKLLPDTVHLTMFSISGEEVMLKGQGSGVPELIGILESSPSFKAADFAAATELDQNSRADSFSLSAKLDSPDGVPVQ